MEMFEEPRLSQLGFGPRLRIGDDNQIYVPLKMQNKESSSGQSTLKTR